MKVLADSNILLRYGQHNDPKHQACCDALDRLVAWGHEPCVCSQTLAEFWVVTTRPASVNGLGLTFDEAIARLTAIDAAFSILPDPPHMARHWRAVIEAHRVMGRQAHDARLAALMLAHGVTHILTLNPRDFARYDGITPVTPQEIHQTP